MNGKIITSFHGVDVNQYPKSRGRDIYNKLFRKGDLFTCNTNFTKERVEKLGCPPKKIKILPVGLRLENFEFRERHFEEGKPIRILTVGRLVEKRSQIRNKGYF